LNRNAAHKNTVARTITAEHLAQLTESLGPDRLFADRERSTTSVLLSTGVVLLLDGSLDTRTEAKRIFAALSSHPRYDDCLEDLVKPKKDLEKARKTLRSIKPAS